MQANWMKSLQRTIESKFAPKWNTIIGDRITENDFKFVKAFEEKLHASRDFMQPSPNEEILRFVRALRFYSEYFFEKLGNLDISIDFEKISFMTREYLQNKIVSILPVGIPLDRLIVNPTSGTTGQPILAPNHPMAIGCYVPLIEYSLLRHGIKTEHHHDTTTAIQFCYQNETIVYAASHSLAKGAKFAKINLNDKDWKLFSDKNNFIAEQNPTFFSGDPFAFEEAMKGGITFSPQAIHSTALELSPQLRTALERHFHCKVINFYSLNETGPLAYSCPHDPEWMHILPHDIYIELIDSNGERNTFGEVTITGGRNPFLPLLRYKTGDFAEISYAVCSCGEKSPKIQLLQGRKPILFQDTQGNRINPVDISRILRKNPNILRHQFIQKKNNSYELNLSWYVAPDLSILKELKDSFLCLLGADAELSISDKLSMNETKQMVFINEAQSS